MYTDSGGNNPCLAALGLTMVDGPVIPIGDIAGLLICLRYLAIIGTGVVTVNSVANAPDLPGVPRVREIPRIIPLEEILGDCWLIIRPKNQYTPTPNPSPDSYPTIYPFPVRVTVTPPVATPQPTSTKEPFKKHIALGNSDYLGTFLGKLNASLIKQNALAYIAESWHEVGLSNVPANMLAGTFHTAFEQAITRAEHIHFNLQGISNPKEWAENHGKGDVYKDADYVTAWELYNIYHNSAALSKTTFYPNGFTSLP